jgi:hypothetical protein
LITEKRANTYDEISHVLACMNYNGDPYHIMFVYGFWKNGICLGGTYLTKTYPYTFTVAYKNANSISIAKALGNVLRETTDFHNSLLGEIKKTNVRALKHAQMLGFKKIYSTEDTVVLEFKKEYWRYKSRWTI